MPATIYLTETRDGYREVEAYAPEAPGEWLFRVFKDTHTGTVVRCAPRFTPSRFSDFGEEGAMPPPEHITALIEAAMPHVLNFLNDTTVQVGAHLVIELPVES